MLKKLFKHEWHSFYFVPTLAFIIFAVISILLDVSIFTPVWDSENPFFLLFDIMIIMVYYFGIIAIVLIPQIICVVRFYKNLFTDEGYLMFTLPVKTSDLLNAKLLVSFTWQLISYGAVFISLGTLGIALINRLSDSVQEFFRDFIEFFEELGDAIVETLCVPSWTFVLWLILIILVSNLLNILYYYTCICLGQLFNKHKILGAIGVYFGLNIVTQFLSRLILLPIMMMEDIDVTAGLVITLGLLLLLVFTGICIGMYYLCSHIMKHKLNLE